MSYVFIRGENGTSIQVYQPDHGRGPAVIVIHGYGPDRPAPDTVGPRSSPLFEFPGAATEAPGVDRRDPPAAALLAETVAINAAAGSTPRTYTSLMLAAWRGQEARTVELIEASIQDAAADGSDRVISLADYARAVLYNGLGRYRAALAAAQRVCRHRELGLCAWALPELVEAGARSGRPDVAAAALRELEQRTAQDATDWVLGIRARCRAVLSDPPEADVYYRTAVQRLASGGIEVHLARAQLLYGEWLRREGRRVDARGHLRAAYDLFIRIGADGFAERAWRELVATGETVRSRTTGSSDTLTAQEAQVARLAGAGHTNPEIGARLFLSPRTVEWHLRKVFLKLGVSSRTQLRGALAERT